MIDQERIILHLRFPNMVVVTIRTSRAQISRLVVLALTLTKENTYLTSWLSHRKSNKTLRLAGTDEDGPLMEHIISA